jgi:hypothetical protein
LEEDEIFGMINTITEIYFKEKENLDREIIIKLLKSISEKLAAVVERYSHAFLVKVGLNDPEYYDHLLKEGQ